MKDAKDANDGLAKTLFSKLKENIADSLSKHVITWVTPLLLAYLTRYLPAARALVWDRRVSMGYLVLACIPCVYLTVLIGIASRGKRVSIVANPALLHISEGFNMATGAPTLSIHGELTVGNPFDDNLILIYAHTRFVQPDSYFYEPLVIPKRRALSNLHFDLMGGSIAWWWRPPKSRRRIKFKVAFVSLSGRRYWTTLTGTFHPYQGPKHAPIPPRAAV